MYADVDAMMVPSTRKPPPCVWKAGPEWAQHGTAYCPCCPFPSLQIKQTKRPPRMQAPSYEAPAATTPCVISTGRWAAVLKPVAWVALPLARGSPSPAGARWW